MFTPYSFADVNIIMRDPFGIQFSANGEGIGDILISPQNDDSAHDVGADGLTMVSKILVRNAIITLNILQTSAFNRYLTQWRNRLIVSDTSVWADTTISITSRVSRDKIFARGVSPQRPADKPFQATGQRISWLLMAADLIQE